MKEQINKTLPLLLIQTMKVDREPHARKTLGVEMTDEAVWVVV